MAEVRFVCGGELGHGLSSAILSNTFRNEHRIVSEALFAGGRTCDGPFDGTCECRYIPSCKGQRDHTLEPRLPPTVRDPLHLIQELLEIVQVGRMLASVPCGFHPRAAAKGVDDQSGVVGQGGEPAHVPVGGGLQDRVLLKGAAGLVDLGRYPLRLKTGQPDRAARQDAQELPQLSRIAGADQEADTAS